MENKRQPFTLGKPYNGEILITGFYDKYITTKEKFNRYLEFLKSEKGKQWKNDCIIERNNFIKNRSENRKNYGLKNE